MAPTSRSSSPLPGFLLLFLWLLAPWESSTTRTTTAPALLAVQALVFQPNKGVVAAPSFSRSRSATTGRLLRPRPSWTHRWSTSSSSEEGASTAAAATAKSPTPTAAAASNTQDNAVVSYDEYVRRQQLRSFLQQSPLFQSYAPIEIEYMVQSCQEVTLSASDDSVLFRQGDPGDALYLVQQGQIEVFNENDTAVLATYHPGDAFGELSLLFGEPRAATARAVTSATADSVKLWKLSSKDLKAVQKANVNASDQSLQVVTSDPKYAQYLLRKQLRDALPKCPVFKGFQQDDLERIVLQMESNVITYPPGETILKQGEPGDAMYIVKAGTVVCTIDPGNKVVADIGPGGYFGELAVLFNQPRAATVRASSTETTSVWKLSADQLFEAAQDYPLGDKALELLKQKYQEDSLLSTLQKASFGEILDLIRTNSRPKKKNVTFHSIVSGVYVGMFLLAYLPQFHPTQYNSVGAPQIFAALDLSEQTIWQYRLCSVFVCLVSLMGEFRIPKNAPQCRKFYFTTMLLTSLAMWSYGDSNVGAALDNYTFDIFSPFGAAFITLANLGAAAWVLGAADNAIAGPAQGRETLPLLEGRTQAALFYSFLYGLFNLQMNNLVWANYDYEGWQQVALPFYHQGFERYGLVAGFTINGALAFGAFFGTLLFEKKISPITAAILNFILMFGTLGDQFLSFQMDPALPPYQAVVPFAQWMGHYREEFHTTELAIAVWALVVANALRKRFLSGGDGETADAAAPAGKGPRAKAATK